MCLPSRENEITVIKVLWVFTMKRLPVCGLVFQRLFFKSNWNVLALVHCNPNVSGSHWLLQSLQCFLCLIVLVKCFTFELSSAQCPFLWAKHFQCLSSALQCLEWIIQGAWGLVGFFFYDLSSELFILVKILRQENKSNWEGLGLFDTKVLFPVSCWIRWMDLTLCTELKWSWLRTDLTPWILPCCGPEGWIEKSVSFCFPVAGRRIHPMGIVGFCFYWSCDSF